MRVQMTAVARSYDESYGAPRPETILRVQSHSIYDDRVIVYLDGQEPHTFIADDLIEAIKRCSR